MTSFKKAAAKLAGTAAILSMIAMGGVAYAQTTTDTTTSAPATPNTGAGGDAAQNIALLGLSGLVALAGGAYLTYKSKGAAH